MTSSLPVRAAIAVCVAFLCSVPAAAGEFSVNPVRLELGAAARSGAISVRNEGKHPLSFQVQAKEWQQDAQGKDVYLATSDLVFFPKIMTVDPGQDGVIRVGTRTPLVATEKTYRLYIEELPSNVVRPEGPGAKVNFLIRFGAPIFVGPASPKDALELAAPALAAGQLAFAARNTGNRHQMVQSIRVRGTDAQGQEVMSLALADRYLLSGASKSYATAIPAEQCHKLAALDVEMTTDKQEAKRRIEVSRSMCATR